MSAKNIHFQVYKWIAFYAYKCIALLLREADILKKRTRVQKMQSDEKRMTQSIMTSVRIRLDDSLIALSCDALEDICAQYGKECSDEALKCDEINQMHDALMFIRSGILSFENVEDEEGNWVAVITLTL